MATASPRVLVIGAGVSGLTTALSLARAGCTVHIVSDREPLETTSVVAGAVWGPYMGTDPRVLEWCLETWRELSRLSQERPESGVRMAYGMEATHAATTPPEWILRLGDFTPAEPQEVPAGYAAAWRYHVPVVEMRTYIRFLLEELADLRVAVEIVPPVRSLTQLDPAVRTLVNCTGLGARELIPDQDVYPVQGQVVVVDNPGVDGFFVDDPGPVPEEPTYFMSHGDHVILGGSYYPHSDRTTPDPAVSAAIVARCAEIEPALSRARVMEHRVGLRPTRHRVRLEREELVGRTIIHNYGHGGAGVTLSWSCAFAARDLLIA